MLRYNDRENIQIRKLYPVSSSTLARLITQFSIVTYDVWQILVILVLVLNFFFTRKLVKGVSFLCTLRKFRQNWTKMFSLFVCSSTNVEHSNFTTSIRLPHQWSVLAPHWSWWSWVKCGSLRDESVYRIWTSRLVSTGTRFHQRSQEGTL